MALSDRIRILLIKRGNISEAELARRLGVSPQNAPRSRKKGVDSYNRTIHSLNMAKPVKRAFTGQIRAFG